MPEIDKPQDKTVHHWGYCPVLRRAFGNVGLDGVRLVWLDTVVIVVLARLTPR